MALSTIGITLNYKTTSGGTFEKIVDIKDFPNIGGPADMIETTTLSDKAQTFIKGVQSQDQMEFTANYNSDVFDTIKALDGDDIYWELQIGPAGVNGKFDWQGGVSIYLPGKGTNEVTEMNIVINPATVIEKV